MNPLIRPLHLKRPRRGSFLDRPEQEPDASVAFLQRLLGYCITGSTINQVFTILYGEEGRNGKDTLLDTSRTCWGLWWEQ
jgi:phage/plasmid-associated DNA primase